MLYWLGACVLVAMAVLLPFVLLYLAVLVSWLALTAIRFMIRNLKKCLGSPNRLLKGTLEHEPSVKPI